MITVDEARERLLAAFAPLGTETVSLADAHGRVLAEDLTARLTQPPFAASAMDGYAVRAVDVGTVPVTLRIVGESRAGGRYDKTVQPGEAVRIFTGAPVPEGTDAVILQEDSDAKAGTVRICDTAVAGRHVRPAGLDFTVGDAVIPSGARLTARHVGLAAAMNRPWLCVYRRPRVAILATGDEIVLPGDPLGPNQIVSSNSFFVAGMVAAAGGVPMQLGIAADDLGTLRQKVEEAHAADVLVTLGGASVGDHDLVQQALGPLGLTVDFWKIAMRPGKPLMFGSMRGAKVLGLPGNPVSAFVCTLIFLMPALARLQGLPGHGIEERIGYAAVDLAETGRRQDFLRSRITTDARGDWHATPASLQDSAMMSVLAQSDGLVVRPAGAPAAPAGSEIRIIRFPGGLLPL